MAFGQKGPGRPRGRPPKDPNARAYSVDEGVYAKRKLDSGTGSVLDPVLARQSMDDVEAALQQVRAQYEQNIDQRILQASREREAIQEQFNRLKELRVTHSEKTLMEWKRASEARQRHAIESLNAWKQRAEHAEHRIRELEREDGSSAAPESGRRVHQLEEEVARLAGKLEVARRERDAQMQRVSELEQKKQPITEQSDGQQAMRGLYEDLTGFYVQEVAVSNEVHNLHRFEMHFTCAGYYGRCFEG
ncbi:hypothetical protein MPSI1_003046 [Malassezia psittaci]|uniref:Uncharacterized protein n=1 Tax=Malassezia psittaci TaxID=1821823 RepID=A0AAF0FGY7_9BASI|nr:hypothetical protein MPSI1_003046 [Malassezia psittaci]